MAQPQRPARRLPAWQAAAAAAGVAAAVCAFGVAVVGTWLLTDAGQRSAFSKTAYARHYYALVEWNQMFNSFLFNASPLVAFMLGTRLAEHRRAGPPPGQPLSRSEARRAAADGKRAQAAAKKEMIRQVAAAGGRVMHVGAQKKGE